jgi:hypothetical protein
LKDPILTLKSSIKPSLKKSVLIRGTILGALGLSIWLFGGIFLSISTLTLWGWPILICGGLLITWGLLPYRKLIRLENCPNEIVITELEELLFSQQGRPLLMVYLENIEELAFLDDDNRYGIGLWVKKPVLENIITLTPSLDLIFYQEDCQKKYFCDVFLPNFSKRSFTELEEIIKK